ncbi:CmcI family methyltransferase [Thiorhodovibrio frisius]|uniref:Cephalosporin hydroxylase n=1 Tax=Thiorhodovibrio frisius TaxID=631362 RepID=H8Z7A3_9GAMM|nr:CmcI family methyltransferase [Thiorhodovibrio frisius]EIC19819.1 cephalosporin hydroxylase [Thiorhodovibrio frisius]WPL20202.1 Rhamnosyl O-methyltransferase precursor [Thiorhodovibrio frisius]
MADLSAWTPSERAYLLDDLCRQYARASANEGWFRQSWLGVELWQMPQDILRLQAVVHQARPRWIIETGTKFGGSAIFFASLLAMSGQDGAGIMTVDLNLRDEAREVFASHPLGSWVRLALQGDAADPEIIGQFAEQISVDPGPVLVFLDDDHNAEHVQRELEGYAPLLGEGDWLIVADTIFADLAGTPVGQASEKYPNVTQSNPRAAIERFLAKNPDFQRVSPPFDFGPGNFLDGFLRREWHPT